VLVNNAGATWGADTVDHPFAGWRKVLDVNLTGAFLLSQEVGRRWTVPARYGRIVNVASFEGLIGHDAEIMGTIAYNTAKGGLVNFTRALAAEWGGRGITVNALVPGFFPSKMTAATLDRLT
jgi:NAD(P)-dependent dehydrogenase (short-subunit alcohol dehydrogenase family)